MQEKLQYILMGLRCLPDNDNRIVLWRNTIKLFHKQIKVNYTGPFFAAGYKNYRIESPLSERDSGKERSPDIFSYGPNGWLVIELTCDDGESQRKQLDDDKNLDPRDLSSQYGWPVFATAPDTVSSRLLFNDDGDHCQIVVKDIFDIKKEQNIQDNLLRTELTAMRGRDLTKLPEIPFSLVPEMKHYEIRRGLVDIVIQIFDPKSQGKTPNQICEDALDQLFKNTTSKSREKLIRKINTEMEVLIRSELAGYLEFKDGKYRVTEKFKEYPKTRQVIALKLQTWARATKQRTWADFDERA
jgi:hypothetical protein